MRAIRSKDMRPELAVRKSAHTLGYRFRLHRVDLPGKPDLVFPRLRKIIFVHGCFWHSHQRCSLSHAPKTNLSYWEPKLEKNKNRDRKNLTALRKLGWEVAVIWECETRETNKLAARLTEFLSSKRYSARISPAPTT
jgi:DNA mismatch endonuclease (patch repair protein)